MEEVSAHAYHIANLEPGTEYNVIVTAVCSDNNSANSDQITFSTLPNGVNEYVSNTLLYPNPTTGQFTIQNVQCIIENVEILDVFGKMLNSMDVNNNKAIIDINSYASGVYFTRIYTDKGIITKRIVKK